MDAFFKLALQYTQTKFHKYGTRPLAYGIYSIIVLLIMELFAIVIAFIISSIFTIIYAFLGFSTSKGDIGTVLGFIMITLVVLWNTGWVVYWIKNMEKKYNLLEKKYEQLELILLKKGFMKIDICQSCGMPITPDVYGTNADGSKNDEYCICCYKDGAFTTECSMEMMIDFTSQGVNEFNENTGKDLTRNEYKEELRKIFPLLKRWQSSATNTTKEQR